MTRIVRDRALETPMIAGRMFRRKSFPHRMGMTIYGRSTWERDATCRPGMSNHIVSHEVSLRAVRFAD